MCIHKIRIIQKRQKNCMVHVIYFVSPFERGSNPETYFPTIGRMLEAASKFIRFSRNQHKRNMQTNT